MKIGVVSFKDSVSSILPLPCKVQEQMSNTNYLHLYSQKYTRQNWNQIMKHISQIDVQEMQLSDNNYEHILKEISPISFPSLKSLSLISNHIKSIQPLCQVQMPCLQIVYLSRNEISRLSPMRKAHWPALKSIIMNDNPFVDCAEILPQCCFPELGLIIMEGWSDSYVFATDVAFVVKMQTPSLKYLNIQSHQRINRPAIETYLLERYRKLRVNVRK